jgi:hypothetical protein
MNHKDKVRLARHMQSRKELTTKGEPGGLFSSKAWERRSAQIAHSVRKRARRNQIRREDRERAAMAGFPVKYRMR